VIRIGIPLLMHALQEGPAWPEEFRVTDPMAFAKAIAFHLQNDEEEDGTTAIHRALDEAAIHAIENACDGVEDVEPDEPTDEDRQRELDEADMPGGFPD